MINTIIGLAIIGAIGYVLYKMYTAGKESLVDVINKAEKKLDVNGDGKINVADLKAEVKVVEDKVVSKAAAASAKIKSEIDAIDSKVVAEIKKVKK